jgi:phenylacetate-CoA ligase
MLDAIATDDGPDLIEHRQMNAPLRAMLEQVLASRLEQSQWWTAERLERAQFRRLTDVLAHAYATVPYYRGLFDLTGIEAGTPLTPESWQQVPVLTRRDIQDAGDELLSRRVPKHHGRRYTTQTSGSSGQPVKVCGTGLNQVYWRALTLRDHLWHRRDLGGRLCVIRPNTSDHPIPPEGRLRRGWGSATDQVSRAGTLALLALGADVSVQAEWLRRHDPDYLLSFPSNVLALADHFLAHRLSLPRLREVRAIGETVTPAVIEGVRAAWNVPVVDLYSSQEAGVIALQCPSGSGLYHVQSESVKVEVLNEGDRLCAPGETGRIVVSTLHNFAMPLLRYDLRDFAEAGPLCPCGRGLPTLRRILGRKRNMLVLPSGEKRWPLSGFREYREIAPIRQFQLVQLDRERIEARFVADRPITTEEEQRLAGAIQHGLGHPFRIQFTYLDAFASSPTGKFEDFVSMVEQ